MSGDHFQGYGYIELQPGDRNFPAKFLFNPASASTKNDGSLPYGSTLVSVVSTVKNIRNADATTSIISSSFISGNNVVVFLNHSSSVRDGKYILTMKIDFSVSGSTLVSSKEFDFRRLILRNE